MPTKKDIDKWIELLETEEKHNSRAILTRNETMELIQLLKDIHSISDEKIKKAVKGSLKSNMDVSLFSAFGEFSMVARDTNSFVSVSADSNRVYLAHNKVNQKMVRICIKYLQVLYEELIHQENCDD